MEKAATLLNTTLRQSIFVGLLTWLLAFGYQLIFYFYYEILDRSIIQGKETVFSYHSGMEGDGILVPLTNVLVFLLVKRLEFRTTRKYLYLALLFGLSFTLAAHYLQASLDLTNWSMPTAFRWSGVGRFHFFFMWAETSYLFYALILSIYKYKKLLLYRDARMYLALSVLSLLAFGGTFLADYLGVLKLYA
jgi:hypothetical protein